MRRQVRLIGRGVPVIGPATPAPPCV
jgi:hypothetical protein